MKRSRATVTGPTIVADAESGTDEVTSSGALSTAPLQFPVQLLGTVRYTFDTLGCALGYLDTLDLGALSRASRAHQAAVAYQLRSLTNLFIYRRLDRERHLMELSTLGLRLAVCHARSLRTISMSPADPGFDRRIRPYSGDAIGYASQVMVDGNAHAGLTVLQSLLPRLIAHNGGTLRQIRVPDWFYWFDTVQAMGRCSKLTALRVPVALGRNKVAQVACRDIVLANASSLESVSLRGVDDRALEVALARLPLTDLHVEYAGDPLASLEALGACTALTRLAIEIDPRGTIDWRRCYEAIAAALPELRRLEHFDIDSVGGGGENLGDVEWRLAPSVRSLKLQDAWRMPRLVGAGVRQFEAGTCTTAKLVRMVERLPGIDTCTIRTLDRWSRVRHRHLLRAAFERGLFACLRVARFCGADDTPDNLTTVLMGGATLGTEDTPGNLLLGGATLGALAQNCPLLEELCATVHATFDVDHLGLFLGHAPRLRALRLSFSSGTGAERTRGSCASKLAKVMTPIALPNLETLESPVASDDLVARLACPRLRTLRLLAHHIALRRWPAFPTLGELHIQLDRKEAPEIAKRQLASSIRYPHLDALAIGWSGHHSFHMESLWAALAASPSTECLVVHTRDCFERVVDALAWPQCPETNLRRLSFRPSPHGSAWSGERRPLAKAFAAKHPRLTRIFNLSDRSDELGFTAQFRGAGIAIIDCEAAVDADEMDAQPG